MDPFPLSLLTQNKLLVTSEFNPELSFSVCAYVKDDFSIGLHIIKVSKLQEKYPHLEPANPAKYRMRM